MSEVEIIHEPSVYLVGRQEINDDGLNRFLADHDVSGWETDTDVAAQQIVETAGRLCYLSFAKPRPGGNKAYIGHILEVGHGSVLEHAVFNLIITGVSRSLSHELVRHRAGFGYSQLSQRFVDESECEFVVPSALADEVREAEHYIACKGGDYNMAWLHSLQGDTSESLMAGLKWLFAMVHTQTTYSHLSDYLFAKYSHIEDKTARRKAAREAARSVLPNATETKIFVTANARALRHFIEMRANPAADAEIRRVAVAILRLLQAEAPNLFGDYRIDDLPQGGEAASTTFRKV